MKKLNELDLKKKPEELTTKEKIEIAKEMLAQAEELLLLIKTSPKRKK